MIKFLSTRLLLLMALLIPSVVMGASYTWNGATNTSWATATNWTPNGVPGAADNVTIQTATNLPVLDASRSVTNLTVNSGTLGLNTFTLTVTGVTNLAGGTVSNGTLTCTGTSATFSSTTINAAVNATCADVYVRLSSFGGVVTLNKTGSNDNNWDGGNTFNQVTTITNSGNGRITTGNFFPDIFNSNLNVNNSGSNSIIFAGAAAGNQFNGNIVYNITNASASIQIGSNGSSTLAAGKTITAASGFSMGWLYLIKVTQTSATSQSVTGTGSTVFLLNGCSFGGNFTAEAGTIYLTQNTFSGTTSFTQTGGTTSTSYGGNDFVGPATIGNTGTGTFTLTDLYQSNLTDTFRSTLTINNTGGGTINIAKSGSAVFKGNVLFNSTNNSTTRIGTSTLETTKTFTQGTTGFVSGTLNLQGMSQIGTTAQSLTGTGILNMTSCNFQADFTANVGQYSLTSNTFSGNVSFKNTVSATLSPGGNTFGQSAVFINTSSGQQRLDNSTPSTYNGQVSFTTGSIGFSVFASSFKGNVIVNYDGPGILYLSGTILYAGKTLTANTTSSTGGRLGLSGFIQQGSTAQNIVLTGTASSIDVSSGTTFNGATTLTASTVFFAGGTFNNDAVINKTGSSWDISSGNNSFAQAATFNNTGSGNLDLGTSPNTFNGDVTFNNTGTGFIALNYAGITKFYKNITCNGSVNFTSTGSISLEGGNAQTLSGSGQILIPTLAINKTTGNLTLAAPLNISQSLSLVKGNIISSSANILFFQGGSSVSGASSASYVEGPVKAYGTASFTYPVGKSGVYQGIQILASSSSDLFTAEYFHTAPPSFASNDGSIPGVSQCQYWTVNQNVGTSPATVKLLWDANTCSNINTSIVQVARYYNNMWQAVGGNNIVATTPGSVSSNSISSFGIFTFSRFTCDMYNVTPIINLSSPANFAVLNPIVAGDQLVYNLLSVPALSPPKTSYELITQVTPQQLDPVTNALVPNWMASLGYSTVYPAGSLSPGTYTVPICSLVTQQETDKSYFWRVGLIYKAQDVNGVLPISWGDTYQFTVKGTGKAIPAATYLAAGDPNASTHTNKINWAYEVTYLDDNKTNQSISYSDGLGFVRQGQTLLNTANKIICSETAYSEEGGGAVQSMSAPTGATQFGYAYRFFDVNIGGVYSDFATEHFDREVKGTTSNSIMTPVSVDNNTGGVGYYYSSSNTMESYVDDAQGYPYAYSVAYKDPLGRMMMSGGVGSTFKITGGKEIRAYTTSASTEELARVYGKTKAGTMTNISKSIVTDPNGVSSISYKDMEGKVIATALATCSTPGFDALTEDGMAAFTSRYDVLKNDKLNKDNLERVSNSNFFVPCGNISVSLHYEIDLGTYTIETGNCQNCLYDLTIKVVEDATGAVIFNNTQQLPSSPPAASCSTAANHFTFDQNVTVPNGGTYTVTRTLKPHVDAVTGKDARQQAIETYINTLVSDPGQRTMYKDLLTTEDALFVLRKLKTGTARMPQMAKTVSRYTGLTSYNSAYTDGTLAASTMGNNVQAIDIDKNGTIYFLNDDYRIRKISGGTVSTLVNTQSLGYMVTDITCDDNGNVYFTDNISAGKIRKVTSAGAVSDVYTGKTDKRCLEHVNGNIYFTHASATSPATKTNISKISIAGSLLKDSYLAAASELPYQASSNQAKSMVVRMTSDGKEEMYLSSTSTYVVYKVTGTGTLTVLAGLSGTSASTDGTFANARFISPKGIATDKAGNLYIADNYTVRKLDLFTSIVSTVAGSYPSAGFTDGPTDLPATLSSASDLALDNTGNIFIGQQYCIRKVSDYAISAACPEVLPATQVTYNQLQPVKLTLQPGSEGKDAYVFSRPDAVNNNIGSHPTTSGAAWTWNGTAGVYRALIDFDRSSIPSGAYILDARLSLYSKSGMAFVVAGHSTLSGSNASWLERITQAWKEDSVTWNNQPATTATNRVSLAQSTSQYQSYENIDVTALIRDMTANPSAGFGFMLKLQDEGYYRQLLFGSGDNPDPSVRPKLEITYVAVPPVAGCTSLETQATYATVTVTAVPGPSVSGSPSPISLGTGTWSKGMTAEQFATNVVSSINANSTTTGFIARNVKGGSYFGDNSNTLTITAPSGTGSQYNGWQIKNSIAYNASIPATCFVLDVGSANKGSELQTNGSFSSASGGWYSNATRTTALTVTPPAYTGNGSSIYTSNILSIGKRYKLAFDVTAFSGAVQIQQYMIQSAAPGYVAKSSLPAVSVAGKYLTDFIAEGEFLQFTVGSGSTIDNISITEADQLMFRGGFNANACNEYQWYADKVTTSPITVGGVPKLQIADLDGIQSGSIGDEQYIVDNLSNLVTIDPLVKAQFLEAYERMHWVKLKESDIVSMQTYTVNTLATLPALLDNKSLVTSDPQSYYLVKMKFKAPSCEDKCKARDFSVSCNDNCNEKLQSLDVELLNAYNDLSTTPTVYTYNSTSYSLKTLVDAYYPFNGTLIDLVDNTDRQAGNLSNPPGLNLYLGYESARTAREQFDMDNCLRSCNGNLTNTDKCASAQEGYRSCVSENISQVTQGANFLTDKWDLNGSFPYANTDQLETDRASLGNMLYQLLISYFAAPASYPRIPVRSEWDFTTTQKGTSCSNCGAPANTTYGCSAGTAWDVSNFPDILLSTLVTANNQCGVDYLNNLDMTFNPSLGVCKQNNANCKSSLANLTVGSPEYNAAIAQCDATYNCSGAASLSNTDDPQRYSLIRESLGRLYASQDVIDLKTPEIYNQTKSLSLGDLVNYLFVFEGEQRCLLECSSSFEAGFSQWLTQKMVSAADNITNQFINTCYSRNEKMTASYTTGAYHYTLYNYNAANDLISTVPPEGIDYVNIEDPDPAKSGRVPQHRMLTTYTQNSVGELTQSFTPDGNNTKYLYDKAGRIRFSQTDEQAQRGTAQSKLIFSYTKYDTETGRILETGEYAATPDALGFGFINPTPGTGNIYASDKIDDFTWPTDAARTFEENYFYFDQTYLSLAGYTQENVANRVSMVSNEHSNSYYSYDKHGRVKTFVQEILDMEVAAQRFKTTDYEYKPLTSQVIKVTYQKGNAGEEFGHRFTYDQDNRVTQVEVSRDGTNWARAANYEYYLHGDLKAKGVGDDIQRMNYVYNLQGWLKAINHPLQASDPGQDGITGPYAKDVFGMVLNYYSGDYKLTGKGLDATASMTPQSGTWVKDKGKDLFNGNISSWITYTGFDQTGASSVNPLLAQGFRYDVLNRLVGSFAETKTTSGFTGWTVNTTAMDNIYQENISYDANGNIKTLVRTASKRVVNGAGAATTALDNMTYRYDQSLTDFNGNVKKANNKLNYISDILDDAAIEDIKDQSASNYAYDGKGRLIKDLSNEIQTIIWYANDKVKEVIRTSGSAKPGLQFTYDALGKRISKKVIKSTTDQTQNSTVYYAYNASVQAAIYEKKNTDQVQFTYTVKEEIVYGTDRCGVYRNGNVVYNGGTITATLTKSQLYFELTDHLGNVRAVVTGQKNGVNATIANLSDYYPFGMSMPGRQFSNAAGDYRYGYNGKEEDDEWSGDDNMSDYGFRMYDPRIGRFNGVDPLSPFFPELSTYQYASNSPILFVDLDGLEANLPKRNKNTGNLLVVYMPEVNFSETEMNAAVGKWDYVVVSKFSELTQFLSSYGSIKNLVIVSHGIPTGGMRLGDNSDEEVDAKAVANYLEGNTPNNEVMKTLDKLSSKLTSNANVLIEACWAGAFDDFNSNIYTFFKRKKKDVTVYTNGDATPAYYEQKGQVVIGSLLSYTNQSHPDYAERGWNKINNNQITRLKNNVPWLRNDGKIVFQVVSSLVLTISNLDVNIKFSGSNVKKTKTSENVVTGKKNKYQ